MAICGAIADPSLNIMMRHALPRRVEDDMVLIEEAFRMGDVYLDYPFEDVKFRWEKQTRKVLRHGRKVERRRAL